MLYNVFYKFDLSTNIIFGLNEVDLQRFLNDFENGEDSFFYEGEKFFLSEEIKKVVVFDLSKIEHTAKNVEYLKKEIRKKRIFAHQSFEDASKEYGINVTTQFIVHPFGYKKKTVTNVVNLEEYVNLSRIEELENCQELKSWKTVQKMSLI